MPLKEMDVPSPIPEVELQESHALLQKLDSHDDDMHQMLCDAHEDNTKLRKLLKLVLLRAGDTITMQEVLQSVGEGGLIVDPRPDIHDEAVLATAAAAAAPMAGEGKWFETQMKIRKLESQRTELLTEIEAYSQREQHLRAVSAESDARCRSALEDLGVKQQALLRQDQDIVEKAAAHISLDLELQRTKAILQEKGQTEENLRAHLDTQAARLHEREAELAEHASAVARLSAERNLAISLLSTTVTEHAKTAATVGRLCRASNEPHALPLLDTIMRAVPPGHASHDIVHNPHHQGVSYLRSVSPKRQQQHRNTSPSPATTDPIAQSPPLKAASLQVHFASPPLVTPKASLPFPSPPVVSPIVQSEYVSPAKRHGVTPGVTPGGVVHTAPAACVVLHKTPGGPMGLSWSTVGNMLTLRAVDQGSSAWEAGCVAFVGRRLVSACGVPVRTALSLSAVTLPMSRVDLVFDSDLREESVAPSVTSPFAKAGELF